ILETVDLKLGPVAAGVSEQEARAFIDAAERQGLLTRRGVGSGITRAHPLVRDFLKARLSRSEGQKRVREIHEAVPPGAGPEDWHSAARQYVAAGLDGDARQVLSSALERILATGLYLAADEISAALAGGALYGVPGLILQSRVAQQRGVLDEAVDLAERAREL